MKKEKIEKITYSLCTQMKILWCNVQIHLGPFIPLKSHWSQHNIDNFICSLILTESRLPSVVFLNWMIYYVSLTNVFLCRNFCSCVLGLWSGASLWCESKYVTISSGDLGWCLSYQKPITVITYKRSICIQIIALFFHCHVGDGTMLNIFQGSKAL